MSDKEPVICPHCGATMNHHATKIDYSVEEPGAYEAFDGTLEEVHTCPRCTRIELRRTSN